MAASPQASWQQGDRVQVFYRAAYHGCIGGVPVDPWEEWHAAAVVPTPLLSSASSTRTASQRLCLTAGWLDATVLRDSPARSVQVLIRYAHDVWCNSYGAVCDATEEGCLDDWVDVALVRWPPTLAATLVPPSPLPFPRCRVSFAALRWGGQPGSEVNTTSENWGPSNSSVSTTYINALFEQAYQQIGLDYQVLSLFVGGADDLSALSDSAPGIVDLLRRHSERICAMYFLWPVTYGDSFLPTPAPAEEPTPSLQQATAAAEAAFVHHGARTITSHRRQQQQRLALGGGYVEAAPLLALMKAMECEGMPTRFPHPAPLYELLVSKTWQPMLCGATSGLSLNIPATTAVPRGLALAAPAEAGRAALDALRQLRSRPDADGCGGGDDPDSARKMMLGGDDTESAAALNSAALADSMSDAAGPVVVKLGYSWEAADVVILGRTRASGAADAAAAAGSVRAYIYTGHVLSRPRQTDRSTIHSTDLDLATAYETLGLL